MTLVGFFQTRQLRKMTFKNMVTQGAQGRLGCRERKEITRLKLTW